MPTVYMTCSKRGGTLYIGVTSDLPTRIADHKSGRYRGFSHRYNVTRLVWYETHPTMTEAIQREKRLKRWRRAWKIELIEADNPHWNELPPPPN